jgi:uncharacterized protein YsxB (DUF464 family)
LITVTFENIVPGENGLADFTGENISFSVKGHSTLGKGNDIYCAGVSAIVQSCVAAISRLGGVEQIITRRDGYVQSSMTISGNSPVLREVRAIIGVMITGMELMKSLPGSNIEIIHSEV